MYAPKLRLENKVAIITGAGCVGPGWGNGRAMAVRFAQEGFGPLRASYQARDVLYGQEVVCTDGTIGQARGVDEAGALLLHTASGLQKISSAEVSVRPKNPVFAGH